MAQRFLIIQTASIGDVILATPVIEKMHAVYPGAKIDFLTKKGNESLFEGHPFLNEVLIWDKRSEKNKNLFRLLKTICSRHYEIVINLQRFASTGILTAFSKAPTRIGFDKNPFSVFFTQKIEHKIGIGMNHEIDRNLSLIANLTDGKRQMPRLYPTSSDFEAIKDYSKGTYYCIAPASLWFTKQFPESSWVTFLKEIDDAASVYLLGSKSDIALCDELIKASGKQNIKSLAGKISLLQSAALMRDAKMNFMNDSSPMHLASSVNAPTTAIFCSTVTSFGFGPLSEDSIVVQTEEKLACRPCGLHGHKKCPKKHFKCGYSIDINRLINRL